MQKEYTYYIIYKPFGMLSQFSRETATQITLADLVFKFPKDVYPVGRLDADSEGLLLLTNDPAVNARLLSPRQAHPRTYWGQVEGTVTDMAIQQLQQGVEIKIDGTTHRTRPAKAHILIATPVLPDRTPPVRYRKSVPDSWIALTLTEGKNRQVRRMCAAVGFPILRLVRVQLGGIQLGTMQPGDVVEITDKALIYGGKG
jgi:23S rRNA pseudouridine2457 synthase